MRRFSMGFVVVLAVCALALAGCKKGGEEGKTGEPAGAGATDKAAEPAKADAGSAPAAKADATAAVPAAPAAIGEVKTAVNKDLLAKAYEEIYCAQKKGQTDQILDIYKKYGFATPKDWTEAWARTSEDAQWQADLTKRIQGAKCE